MRAVWGVSMPFWAIARRAMSLHMMPIESGLLGLWPVTTARRAISFQRSAGTSKFQYSYTSTPTMFEALAVGDLDCDGIAVTYRLVVDAPNGNPHERIEEPTNED